MKDKLYIIITTLAMLLSSCSQNDTPHNEEDIGQRTEVLFSLKVEDQKEVITKSRAGFENDIISIDILIFDERDRFIAREQIDEFTVQDGIYSFKSQLETTNNRRKIHFIANLRDTDGSDRVDLGNLVVGVTTESVVSDFETTELTSNTVSTIFPHVMWGKVTLDAIYNGVSITDVKLIRSVASISMVVDPSVTEDRFSLLAISVHNASSCGYVTPISINSSDILPSVPNIGDKIYYISYFQSNLGFWKSAVNNECHDLFIYENRGAYIVNGEEITGLSFIVKARYMQEECFYRVSPEGLDGFMEYVRNHKYIMKITRVDGKGHNTIESAMANPPSNLHVEIEDNSDRFTNVVSDGSNILGVTATELFLYSESLNMLPLVDILTNNRNEHITVNSATNNLKFTKQVITSQSKTELRVGITPLSLVESVINDIVDIQDVKSGLNRQIPLLVNPHKSLLYLKIVPIVLRSDNLTSWSVAFSNRVPISIKVNGENIDSNYYNGGSNDELSIFLERPSKRNSYDDHAYLVVKGIKADLSVFNRLFIVQY